MDNKQKLSLATAKAALELIYATYGALPAGLVAKWALQKKLGRAERQLLEDFLHEDDGLLERNDVLSLYNETPAQVEQRREATND